MTADWRACRTTCSRRSRRDHQRAAGREPRGARHLVEAAGDDRVEQPPRSLAKQALPPGWAARCGVLSRARIQWIRTLPASLPRTAHRTPSTRPVPPSPPASARHAEAAHAWHRSTRRRARPTGPRQNPTSRSTASGSPSKTASTVPSQVLRTQPATSCCAARRRSESRKNTPWTPRDDDVFPNRRHRRTWNAGTGAAPRPRTPPCVPRARLDLEHVLRVPFARARQVEAARNTVSSATVSFACMKLCSPPPGRHGSDRLPENSPCITRSSSGSFHATFPFWRHW